jgi:hypothetical protein
MGAALKKAIGKHIRLYTAAGVESYIGILTEVHDDYLMIRDNPRRTFIAVPHIESFHVAEAPAVRRGRRAR